MFKKLEPALDELGIYSLRQCIGEWRLISTIPGVGQRTINALKDECMADMLKDLNAIAFDKAMSIVKIAHGSDYKDSAAAISCALDHTGHLGHPDGSNCPKAFYKWLEHTHS